MVLAVTTDDVKAIAVVVLVVVVVAGIVTALVVRAVVAKLIALAVMLVLAGLVWSQRSSIADCADRAQRSAGASTTCSFFGWSVELPTDRAPAG